jgi:hypothetical protein
MAGIAKPVLSFLNELYPSKPDDSVEDDPGAVGDSAGAGRAVTERIKPADFRTMMSTPSARTFSVTKTVPRKTTTRVQFDAEDRDIDRIRKRIRKPGMSASSVGKYTFEHFLKTECPE